MSATDERYARRFLEKHFTYGQAGYFASEKDGTTWYSVVWGTFPNINAARAAIATLPEELKRRKPWVRRIGDIQVKAIR